MPIADRREILFGDIFSSTWINDVFLQDDAIALGPFTGKGGATCYAPIPPAVRRPNQELVLAHGRPAQAVILSDDCEIESAMERRGAGRLLFAAVGPWPKDVDEAERVRRTSAYFRHPLPPEPPYPGGVVDLRRLFMVDARAVSAPDREACPGEELRARLEQRWAAFASRRGPLAHLSGAQKLARMLEAKGDTRRLEGLEQGTLRVERATLEASRALAVALSHAWELEGSFINRADRAHELCADGTELTGEVVSDLHRLAELAVTATTLLEAVSSAPGA